MISERSEKASKNNLKKMKMRRNFRHIEYANETRMAFVQITQRGV